MPTLSAKPIERKCPTCNGTGFPRVKQPAEPGRKNLSGAVREV
jgi:hypothetical protein